MTQKKLKSLLSYDKDTGIFTWIISPRNNIQIKDIAGTVNDRGYIKISVNKKCYQAHRLAWLYEYGSFPMNQIDHRNQIKNDNRICNLRDITHADNQKNKSLYKNNTSGITGIRWQKACSKWIARISVNNKSIHLGLFEKLDDAILARENAEKLYIFHVNHGK